MKVLIDTNRLISAALKDREPEKVILFIAKHFDFEWIVSPEILEEYKTVLSRDKFGLPESLLNKWNNILEKMTISIEADTSVDFPRYQKDAKFLACALSANAEVFITGDNDFGQAQKLVNTIIISVSLFKKMYATFILKNSPLLHGSIKLSLFRIWKIRLFFNHFAN